MALNPEQANRSAAFGSDLGPDKLAIRRFDGWEEINALFEFRVEAVSDEKNIDFDEIIGTKCNVRINSYAGAKRFFNGILVETHSLARSRDLTSYELVLRPWLWLLTKRSNCRIFKKKKVNDVISDVLGAYGFASYEDRSDKDFEEMEYCVQYNESDFHFLSRLMEENGIYYFFEHGEHDHKLILANTASAHQQKPGAAEVKFRAYGDQHIFNAETLSEWGKRRQFGSGAFVLDDYNYMTPSTNLKVERSYPGNYENASLERFQSIARYEKASDGNTKVTALLEAEQANDHRCRAAGDAVTITPGAKMTLADKPPNADHDEYMILKASHRYEAADYRTGDAEDSYAGNYEFLPASMQYRAPAVTQKPRIPGPVTALVTGSGEIDVDEYGRIEVMFFWSPDRENESSRRVRLSHGWAGKDWGDIKIPRIGMEVIVEFINGDPDYPLVTGCVYNAENMPPYSLPDKDTISGVKSKSVGGSGYNEFIFDDKGGDELIRFHAERDLDGTVKHDERRHVGNNVDVKIDANRTEDIGQKWTVKAGTEISFTCGSSSIVMTPGKITIKSVEIEISASAMLQAKGNAMAKYEAGGPNIITGAIVKIN